MNAFPPKIRNKTGLSDFTVPIIHSTGNTSQSSKARKGNKREHRWKRIRTVFFSDTLESSQNLPKNSEDCLA